MNSESRKLPKESLCQWLIKRMYCQPLGEDQAEGGDKSAEYGDTGDLAA
jgi:hypothetical protein